MNRREILRIVAGGSVVGLAGCQSGGDSSTPPDTQEPAETPTPEPTETPTPEPAEFVVTETYDRVYGANDQWEIEFVVKNRGEQAGRFTPMLQERTQGVWEDFKEVALYVPAGESERYSLTLDPLNAAGEVRFRLKGTDATWTTTFESESPEFSIEILAPDTVTTQEEWGYEVEVTNTGGPGEFRSPVSLRRGDSESRVTAGTASRDFESGETAVVLQASGTQIPAPTTVEIQVEQFAATATVDVEWADLYDPDTIRGRAESIEYDDFFRNFESYQREPIHFEYGLVYQTLYEQSDSPLYDRDYYQMSVTNNEQQYEGDVAVDWFGDERLLEEDVIELWGVAEELYSYETVQGDTRTIPRITMTDVEIREE